MKSFIIALLLVACVFCEEKEENGIVVLTDANFQEFVKQHDSLFIEFHSSKQPNSLSYISSFEKIVKKLNDRGMHPVVAKIDHGKAPSVAQIYRIGKFPVLYHFKKGSPRFYDGELVDDDVELFMEKNIHPDVVIVSSDAEIQEQIDRGYPVIVGHFNKRSSKEFKNYRKACSVFLEYITLAVIGENSAVSTPMNTVDIYADGMKRSYSDKMTVRELKKWIIIKSLPPIIPYERRYLKVMFAKDSGVFDHLLFISSKSYLAEHPELKEMLTNIATEFTGRIFLVNLLETDRNMMEFFGVDTAKLPTLTLVKSGDNEVSKFAFRGEFSEESIRKYVNDYFDGTLEPYYKSEDPYPERDGNVKVLVRTDFDEFVHNPNVNVLVEFVVPRCPRCDELHDDIDVLAGYFVDVPDIDVARVDISKNDIPGLEMRGFPMFHMYPAGDNHAPKIYEREPDLSGLLKFIHDNRVRVAPEQMMQEMMQETMPDPEKEVETVEDEL